MIKTDIVFSVQENGSFHVINNGDKVGIIRKTADAAGWHIDTLPYDASSVRLSPFDTAADARKYATENRCTFQLIKVQRRLYTLVNFDQTTDKGDVMKHVVDKEMVAHLWANQSQDNARNQGGNFYFRDKTLYSYGSHFKVAEHVTNSKGNRAILMNSNSYSVTTSAQQHIARMAIRNTQFPVFYVDVVGADKYSHDKNKSNWAYEIKNLTEKAATARSKAVDYVNEAGALAKSANEYAKFFGLRWTLKMPEFSPEFIAKVKYAKKHQSEINAKRAKSAEAKRIREAAFYLKQWLNHEIDHFPYGYRLGNAFLRVSGEIVETSQGAEVPISHARRLWPIIKRHKEHGTVYERNGHSEHVGQFVVDRIEANGDMQVGCHNFNYSELERISAQLQYFFYCHSWQWKEYHSNNFLNQLTKVMR